MELAVPSHLVSTVAVRLGELKENFPVWTTETVVHGDPHTGNVVLTDDGHRLIDLDDLALGCPEIDLATLYTAYRRFSRIAGTWDRFASSYQHPIDETLLDAFSTLRQLTMIAWLLSLWNLREESRDEAVHRVKSLDSTDEWNPL